MLAVPPSILLFGREGRAQDARLDPTPSCAGPEEETVQQTQGPYYRPHAPLRRNLGVPGAGQQAFTLCGFVVDTRCNPVVDALVEIWHADHEGNYDNAGFGWRGHQRTDAHGRWGFDTIMTQHYAFRTAHYHFRVQAPGGALLTTQLYLPEHARNEDDHLFDARLVMSVDRENASGRYDFVVPV